MRKLSVKITLISPSLIGSAEGFGPIIDSDIVYDRYGIPYIPSRRIKGCFRDSAIEVCEIFELSGLGLIDVSKGSSSYRIVESLFGNPGQVYSSPVRFSNLYLEDYENLKGWLDYILSKDYAKFFHEQAVKNHFTEIRQQTAITDDGVAMEGSLRTVRVAKRGLVFEGTIELDYRLLGSGSHYSLEDYLRLLYFASLNLRRFGTKRTRGFGEIRCTLYENGRELDYFSELGVQICTP